MNQPQQDTPLPRKSNAFPPIFEPCERRLLRSVAMSTGGVLTVNGSGHSDRIMVSLDPSNAARLRVSLNNEVRTFPIRSVREIVVKARGGNDRVTLDQSNGAIMLASRIDGGNGNDSLMGASGPDRIFGGTGDDSIFGANGRDCLCGDAGNDIILGGNHADTLMGAAGDDRLEGNRGRDVIQGQDGNDELSGGKDSDTVMGGSGDDHFGNDDDLSEDADVQENDAGPDHQHEFTGEGDHDDDSGDTGDNQDDNHDGEND